MHIITPETRKIVLSVISGILCFFLSPYGIRIVLENLTIYLPWAILFPIIISMVYGWRYALIVGLSGGALYPFYIFFKDGYANYFNVLLYLSSYVLLSLAFNPRVFQFIKNQVLRILLIVILYSIINYLYYTFLFNYLLSLNPPFWNSNAIKYLSPEILTGIFIKHNLNYLAFIIISYTLTQIQLIRKLFHLNILPEMKNNGRIFLLSVVVVLLIWISYVLLGNSLLHNENALSQEHITLTLLVILTSGIIAAKLIMRYHETQIKNNLELIAAKEKAEESEKQYKSLSENSKDYIMSFDRNHKHLYINKITYDLLQIKPEQLLNKTHRESGLFNPEQCDFWEQNINKVFETNKIVQIQFDFNNGKETIYFDWMLIPEINDDGIVENVLSVTRDITNIKNYETELLKSLREKETLIRELYHRTKNTMQVVRSMIVLQSLNYPSNIELQQLVKNTDDRIQAISLVHQMLYQSQDLSQISIKDYIQNLVALLKQSYNFSNNRIVFQIAVEEHTFLIDTVIPLGLIINELSSNSLKYAFPDGRPGIIDIKLTRVESGNYLLVFSDDGVGVPAGFDFRNRESLGLKLIYSLGEDQLLGKIIIENNNGISCSLEFPSSHYKARV